MSSPQESNLPLIILIPFLAAAFVVALHAGSPDAPQMPGVVVPVAPVVVAPVKPVDPEPSAAITEADPAAPAGAEAPEGAPQNEETAGQESESWE